MFYKQNKIAHSVSDFNIPEIRNPVSWTFSPGCVWPRVPGGGAMYGQQVHLAAMQIEA